MNNAEYRNFDVCTDDRSVTTITLDVPDRPLNVLTHEVMTELEQIIQVCETSAARLVVFRSGKESGFLAGADVNAIASIDSATEAAKIIERGQSLFERIEQLPMPTVAVLHGPCLGGGLELALACDYRLARDNSSTQIGLPEIKLGLIPGWGGTQRLPKLVGLSTALPMILTGKTYDARGANQIGLVDRAIAPEDWDRSLDDFNSKILESGKLPAGPQPLVRRLLDDTRLGRAITLKLASSRLQSKVRDYPALASALKAVRLAFKPGSDGFACERDEFCELLDTPTCRHLLSLFFAREKARNLATWSAGKSNAWHDSPIRKVGVVGAGAMGAGIGALAARRGFGAVLKEIDSEQVRAGRQRVEKLINDAARHKGWSDVERNEALQRVLVSDNAQALGDCDLVIEAVVERDDVKQQVFGMLDEATPRHAILASNTSSLSVSRMAQATQRPTQVAGLHFFNPVHRMELVEVVRAADTDQETVARLVGFVRALGKTPVVTSDSPGFLVNRVLFPYLGEAVLMVKEGIDVQSIDRQIRHFGMPMGPLELLDQVGLDVALHVARSLESVLPGVAAVVEALAEPVEQGRLGKKSGAGFYHYPNGKRGKPAASMAVAAIGDAVDQDQSWAQDRLTLVQRRLVYPMLAESIRCLDERVVEDAWMVDLAMVLGTGFAPHRGGPLHTVDGIGPRIVADNLSRLQSAFGDRFEPPSSLRDLAQRDGRFFEPDRSQRSIESATT